MPSTYSTIRKNIRLDFNHRVYFTKDSFSHANETLAGIIATSSNKINHRKLLFIWTRAYWMVVQTCRPNRELFQSERGFTPIGLFTHFYSWRRISEKRLETG